ncbi:MAG: EamA family transporter [Magnetospirillum sp. WYHS-4]
MKPRDGWLLATVLVVWALNMVFAKAGLAQIPALLMIALRFVLVALLLAPYLRRPPTSMRELAILSGLVGVVHFGLLFKGLEGVGAGPASMASQTFVVWGAVLAWLFYREKLRPLQIAGMALAFAGVAVLAGEAPDGRDAPSFLMVVAAAFTLAYATIRIKRLGDVHPMALNAWIALLGAPQLLAVSLVVESGHLPALAAADWRGWGATAFMAVGGTIVGHGLWYHLVKRYPVNVTVPPTLLSPVLAALFAAWLLDEPLGLRLLLGGAMTLGGVAAIQVFQARAAR